MKVQKRKAGIVRKKNISLKKADIGIRTLSRRRNNGFTASVMKEKAKIGKQSQRSTSHTEFQYRKGKSVISENADRRNPVYQAKRYGKTVTGKTVLQSKRNAAENNTPQFQKNIVGETAGKAAEKVTEATVDTTLGAVSGGSSIVVKEAAKAAVKTARKQAEKLRESVEAAIVKKQKNTVEEEEKRPGEKSTGGKSLMLLIGGGVLLAVILVLVLLLPIMVLVEEEDKITGGREIVEIAEEELKDTENNIGGGKYKDWYGMDADWCAMFVSWCADECGFIDAGVMPKTASVSSMKSWYEKKKLYHKAEGYEPKAGDVIIFGNGKSHTGIVTEYNAEEKKVSAIEGNTGTSTTKPYHKGSRVKKKTYTIAYKYIVGYASPKYPKEIIDIPEPYGSEYSYMGWQTITSPFSQQYKLREEAGMNFDENGFGKIGDRYVIACTLTFGAVGDYIDWELENGECIKTIVGDIKNQDDDGCNKWGHHNGLCVVEFVVDKSTWYGSGMYPTDFHEKWASRVSRAVRSENYWDYKEE